MVQYSNSRVNNARTGLKLSETMLAQVRFITHHTLTQTNFFGKKE